MESVNSRWQGIRSKEEDMGLLVWMIETVISVLFVLAMIPVFVEIGTDVDILQLLVQVVRLLWP